MTIRYVKRGKTVEQRADADAAVQETVRGILADIAGAQGGSGARTVGQVR